jgi:predicted transposase YdaD
MFGIENYDVQATRREARSEGKIEGKIEGRTERQIEDTVNIIRELQISVSHAMRITELPEQERDNVVSKLKRQKIIYTL